jgi:large subunit ribosomal protein L28
MARRCTLTNKGVMTGNNVSHANNKTRRRFLPNLQERRLYSEALGESVRLRIAMQTLRTVEKRGGLDGYLMGARDADLPGDLRRFKRRVAARLAERAAPAAES